MILYIPLTKRLCKKAFFFLYMQVKIKLTCYFKLLAPRLSWQTFKNIHNYTTNHMIYAIIYVLSNSNFINYSLWHMLLMEARHAQYSEVISYHFIFCIELLRIWRNEETRWMTQVQSIEDIMGAMMMHSQVFVVENHVWQIFVSWKVSQYKRNFSYIIVYKQHIIH